MICAKIYLDIQDGREVVVIESTPTSVEGICTVTIMTTVYGVESVAISPEARALLGARFADRSSYEPKRFWGNLGLTEDQFLFMHCAKPGTTPRLVLATDKPFTVSIDRGWSPSALAYMTTADNDLLKTLSLDTPVPRRPLLDAYYNAKRAVGEECGTDELTVRATPADYLTAEQAAAVRQCYTDACNSYSEHEWHYHGELIRSDILNGLSKRFRKTQAELERILARP